MDRSCRKGIGMTDRIAAVDYAQEIEAAAVEHQGPLNTIEKVERISNNKLVEGVVALDDCCGARGRTFNANDSLRRGRGDGEAGKAMVTDLGHGRRRATKGIAING